jgi:hypothetical protein
MILEQGKKAGMNTERCADMEKITGSAFAFSVSTPSSYI